MTADRPVHMERERRLANAERMDAQAGGQRLFPGLRLADLDGVDLNLSHWVLRGGGLRAALFGHASPAEAVAKATLRSKRRLRAGQA